MTQPPYDPERDLPPPDAEVSIDGRLMRYDAVKGYWRVESGPDRAEIGSICWPFSDAGMQVARAYAATAAADDRPLGQR